ncbi:NADH-quinone oxidoreductase subunit L [Candidatus Bathyarchaeota archaeon]|nr:NADH-quinone oxidoreductase subunit L [Candidatus Bathyarchaeota archaeon]
MMTQVASPMDVLLAYPGPWLCWILPIIGALITPLIGRVSRRAMNLSAVLFALSAVLSASTMIPWLLNGRWPGDVRLMRWVVFPDRPPLEVGLLIDPLSIIVANVVALISFLIVVYSVGYMHGDPCLPRYWFFFLFFIGNMLLLVLSDNFIMLLVGWEGVGLCSWGLIGYYYRDEKEYWVGGPPPTPMYSPSHCGMKAFIVTGFGDVLLLAAIFIVYHYAGTFNFMELIASSSSWLRYLSATPGLLSLTALLMLGGPIGKSAQFPLHEWLPEAMAGPTPVSALIHAATMVKAGVYLVARVSPIFYIGYWGLGLSEASTFFIAIAVIGCFTAFLAASQAMVSLELKKALAYSTISQIGYMMLALGVSGLNEGVYTAGLAAGIFHLISHALFKASLFLCAGCVLHAVESIYMSDMGGLRRVMPITHALMLIAALSLSGIPPLSGFWSKDAVLHSCLIAGTPLSTALFIVAAITAAMTFFYSIRFISLTFYGEPSENIEEKLEEGHLHEAPAIMWTPIAILDILVILIGLIAILGLISPAWSPEHFLEERLSHSIGPIEVMTHGGEAPAIMVPSISGAMLLIGGVAGYLLYLGRKVDARRLVESSPLLRGIYTFLWNRWYINSLYYLIFVDGILSLKDALYRWLESAVLDRGLNYGVPRLFKGLYHELKRVQTGVLSVNILYLIIAYLVIFISLLYLFAGGV